MAVTINDVAKAANVSPSTVSRAIAGNPRISSATRENILRIMKELNYHPNLIARSLANKSTKIIGVIVPGTTEKAFQHPFFPEVLSGMASIAHNNKYHILITSVTSAKEEKRVINEYAKSGIAEGIILMAARVKDPAISELMRLGFPFVVIGRPQNEKEITWVDNDNFSISYELTKHMLELGRKRVAFIGVSPDYIVTLDRLEGYKKALRDFNIKIDYDLIIEGKYVEDTGYEMLKKIIDHVDCPDAVVACDDLLAFGAIKLLSERGLTVPGNVAVAGFNNVPLSDYFMPPLTSVDINAFSLGAKAFELLLTNIKSDFKSVDRAVIPARLVIRGSTVL